MPKKVTNEFSCYRTIIVRSVLVVGLITLVAILAPIIHFLVTSSDVPSTATTAVDESSTLPPPSYPELVTRSEWGALPPSSALKRLRSPVSRIIVAQTGGSSCSDEAECKDRVKAIQAENPQLDDIAFNFLVGGDGRVYEGRGFEFEGQHTANFEATEFNSIGICVAFIGNYASEPPSIEQMTVFREFVEFYEKSERIAANHKIFSQDDLTFNPVQATQLNRAVGSFYNFYPLQRVFRREEWSATKANRSSFEFGRSMDWVLVSHTASIECDDFTNCSTYVRNLQIYSIGNGLADIGFNFFVGGDGLVFEGRGWDAMGAHTVNFNDLAIGVAAIGNFNEVEPSQGMLEAFVRLMEEGEVLGKLTVSFEVSGRQETPGGSGPGEAFMKHLRQWSRYKFKHLPTTSPAVTTSAAPTWATTTTTTEAFTMPPNASHFDLLVPREAWNANEPQADVKRLHLPIKRIIVAQTGGDSCATEDACKTRVKAIQAENPQLDDIAFNFLVGGDGRVYEGRGFEFEGQHTANFEATEFNSIGICVAFIGNYTSEAPSDEQITVFEDFIEFYRLLGVIGQGFIVVLQNDLVYTRTRANALNEAIKGRIGNYELQKIYRREEWNARQRKPNAPSAFNRTMDWVMLSHTAASQCGDANMCAGEMQRWQDYNMDVNNWDDIGFNFFVGGDGLVFEGRGWDINGAHTKNYNAITVGVAVIGNFDRTEPPQGMLDAVVRLMEDGKALGKLTGDYTVSGRQETPGGAGPGDAFMRHVKTWCQHKYRAMQC